eukprot:jgi/Mesvir1/11575/Mv04337-RA.1
MEDLDQRLKALGYFHASRVVTGNRTLVHPILAVKLCTVFNFDKELEDLTKLFEENAWGYQHLFSSPPETSETSTISALDALASTAQAISAIEQDSVRTSINELVSQVSSLRAEVQRNVEVLVDLAHSKYNMVQELDRVRNLCARSFKETVEIKEAENKRVRDECARNAAKHECMSAINHALFREHDVKACRNPNLTLVVASILRSRFGTSPVYLMPDYFVRAFEREVCDLVGERLGVATDVVGRLSPIMETKIVEIVAGIMCSVGIICQ